MQALAAKAMCSDRRASGAELQSPFCLFLEGLRILLERLHGKLAAAPMASSGSSGRKHMSMQDHVDTSFAAIICVAVASCYLTYTTHGA